MTAHIKVHTATVYTDSGNDLTFSGLDAHNVAKRAIDAAEATEDAQHIDADIAIMDRVYAILLDERADLGFHNDGSIEVVFLNWNGSDDTEEWIRLDLPKSRAAQAWADGVDAYGYPTPAHYADERAKLEVSA